LCRGDSKSRLQSQSQRQSQELRVELRLRSGGRLTNCPVYLAVGFGSGLELVALQSPSSTRSQQSLGSISVRGLRFGSGPELMDAPPITVHELHRHRHIVMGMSSMRSALCASHFASLSPSSCLPAKCSLMPISFFDIENNHALRELEPN